MKQIAFIGVFLLALTTSVWAQEPVHMSLQEVQDRVAAKKLQLKAAHQAYVAARGDFRQTNAFVPVPQVDVLLDEVKAYNAQQEAKSKVHLSVLNIEKTSDHD